jgi:hypothetical protein
MTDLIKRLEEATAGSADLDREVERALRVVPMGLREDGTWGQKQRPWTASLDAALALAERVLPGWCWMIERHKNGTATAWLHEWNAYGEGEQVVSNTPALALCAAILKATDTGRAA